MISAFADVSDYFYTLTRAGTHIIMCIELQSKRAYLKLRRPPSPEIALEKQTAAGLTEQFQIALMVERAKGVSNGPRFTADSRGARGGRGRRRYSDAVRKARLHFLKAISQLSLKTGCQTPIT